MNKKIKTKWLKALRSGKYEQGKEYLRQQQVDEDGNQLGKESFCCLGVLCDVIKKDLQNKLDDSLEWDHNYDQSAFDESETELSERLLSFVGLKPETQSKLIEMNDNGTSFKKIAGYISKNL